jgi:hypothetical protein
MDMLCCKVFSVLGILFVMACTQSKVHQFIYKRLDQWFWRGGACNSMTYVELYTGLMALNEQLVILFCTAFSAHAINKGCLK